MAIGHINEDDEDWFVDDIIKTTTLSIENSLQITGQNESKIQYSVKLDSYYNSFPYAGVVFSYYQDCGQSAASTGQDAGMFKTADLTSSPLSQQFDYSSSNASKSKTLILRIYVSASQTANFEKDGILVGEAQAANAFYDGAARCETHTVKFYDGAGTLIVEHSVKAGAAVPVPPNPTREGYTFAGWSVPEAGSGITFRKPWKFRPCGRKTSRRILDRRRSTMSQARLPIRKTRRIRTANSTAE